MHLPHSVTLVLVVAVFLGSLVFVVAALFNQPWLYSHWVKAAFCMIGVCGVAWASIRLIMLLYADSLARHTYLTLDHYRTFFAGACIALLALFFLSGEARASLQKWREFKMSRSPKA